MREFFLISLSDETHTRLASDRTVAGSERAGPFAFQEEAWEHYLQGRSGLVNAPTGFGKTFSMFLGTVIRWINEHPKDYQKLTGNGLRLMWVTPLRALAKDIGRAMEEALRELNVPWAVGIRSGDTPLSVREKQKRNMPEVLIITPESLHILLAQKEYPKRFEYRRPSWPMSGTNCWAASAAS